MPVYTYLPTARFELRLSRECDARPSTSLMQDDVLQLYDAAAPALRRYVRSCGLTPESAEDVVQEAFLALFRHLCGGGARHNLRGWLVQVSYRLALKDRERRTRRQRVETPWEAHLTDGVVDPTDNPEAELAMRRHRCRLQSVFRALPERERQCLACAPRVCRIATSPTHSESRSGRSRNR